MPETAMNTLLVLFLNLFICLSVNAKLNENHFPEDFMFGVSSSAYQIEGAWNISGKGENIWDKMTHSNNNLVVDKSNGDIACDSYNKYEEDVRLMKELGVQSYRFSLSWSRILPKGFSYKVNKDGIRYYNNLINLLLKNNIVPMIALFHCDTPFSLDDLGGFSNKLMIQWFEDYARVVFEHFGDRVKFWLTLSDPSFICFENCNQANRLTGNDSVGVFEYMCAHNVLKAHAKVYHLYKNEYQDLQKGKIGLVHRADWFAPGTPSTEDLDATQRAIDFQFGIFADPIYSSTGDFPEVVKSVVSRRSEAEGFRRSRLPSLTREEVEYIKGTFDFIALKHYSTSLVVNRKPDPIGKSSFFKDMGIKFYENSSWPVSSAPRLRVVPTSIKTISKYIKKRYGNIEIIFSDNGYSSDDKLNDVERIEYYKQYLSYLLDAIYEDKVNIKGFFAWSLLDNFEWLAGYTQQFGLYHVDFTNPDRPRTPKLSAKFYGKSVKERKIDNSTYSSMSNTLILLPVLNVVVCLVLTQVIHKFFIF